LFDNSQEETLRKCVVFYSAVGADNAPESFDIDRIDSLTNYKIRTDLVPVIRKKEIFDFAAAQERVKIYLTKLLVLTDNERFFLDAFRNNEYHPDLLFSSEMLERVKRHPMALWKCR